jgi:hypothetical protein
MVRIIYDNLLSDSIVQAVAGVIICFFISLQINRITITNRLLKDNTYFQGVFLALFCTIFSVYSCSPELIALWFFLSAISQIFKWYNNNHAIPSIFLGGFYSGAASILHFPYFYYFLFGFVALIIMRSYSLKESLQYIVGFIAPFYLVFGFQIWFDVTEPITIFYVLENIGFNFPEFEFDWVKVVQLSLFAFMLIFTLLSYTQLSRANIIPVQKKIDLLYWVVLFSFVFLFFRSTITVEQVFPMLPVSAVVVTAFLLNQKNKLIPELVHFSFLMTAIVLHYLPIFLY